MNYKHIHVYISQESDVDIETFDGTNDSQSPLVDPDVAPDFILKAVNMPVMLLMTFLGVKVELCVYLF